MKISRILTLMTFVFIGFYGFSQVAVTGELRPRTEYSHGYKALAADGQKASIFTSQRTRLNFGYTSDVLTSKVVLQDVRLWGSQMQLVGNEDMAVSVHEAWAEAPLFGNLSIKAGRQELVYDDHRIFGSVGWAQQARSHDVAILKFKSAVEAHVGLALNQNSNRSNNLYNGPDAYKAMQFLWVNKKLEKLDISLLALNNGVPFDVNNEQETVYSQTVGTHIKLKATDDLNLAFNAYYQGGNVVFGGAKTALSAYNILAEAHYKMGKIKWTLGYELLSGNDVTDNSVLQSFTPLYGTNHKFNGFMDYFYVGNHVHNFGLSDFYLKAAYAKDKSSTSAHVHVFSPGTKKGMMNSGMLGVEFDLSYGYALSDVTKLSVGYSHMIGTEHMEALKGGSGDEISNWAYLMFTFKPNFWK